MRLSEFEGLINSYDGLNPREVVSMKIIHKKLFEAYSIAKKRKQEVLHEIQEQSRTIKEGEKNDNGTHERTTRSRWSL